MYSEFSHLKKKWFAIVMLNDQRVKFVAPTEISIFI